MTVSVFTITLKVIKVSISIFIFMWVGPEQGNLDHILDAKK